MIFLQFNQFFLNETICHSKINQNLINQACNVINETLNAQVTFISGNVTESRVTNAEDNCIFQLFFLIVSILLCTLYIINNLNK